MVTPLNSDSRSLDPQVGQVGCFSPRSRIVIVTVNSFWHFGQRNSYVGMGILLSAHAGSGARTHASSLHINVVRSLSDFQ